MKTKDLRLLRSKQTSELVEIIQNKRRELGKAKIKIMGGQEKNLKHPKHLELDIAQIMTVIREKSRREDLVKK